MKITIEERNVMTLINIARIISDSLKYVDNPKNPNFNEEERKNYLEALNNLTSEGSPFDVNCKNNGEFGKQLADDMKYYIEDVFTKDGRIVSSDLNDKIIVEESLLKELYSTIIKLRIRIELIIQKGIEVLEKRKILDNEVSKLFELDQTFFHAYGSKIGCRLLVTTFIDLNEANRLHYESYSKSHNGIDPNKDPNFDRDDDASVRMLANEFRQLNQDLVDVMNTYKLNNTEFKKAKQEVINDFKIFTGEKQTTDIQAFANLFVSYFNKLIPNTLTELNKMYSVVGGELTKFDQELIAKLKKQKGE